MDRRHKEPRQDILYKEECYRINGACFEVYREKGCGFVEPVYQECFEKELALQRIPFEAQRPIAMDYKGDPLTQIYRPDIICYGKIIVELKALKVLLDEHRAQAMNYLKATKLRLALLVNFGHYPGVEIERIVI